MTCKTTLIICPKCEGDGHNRGGELVIYSQDCTLCGGKGVVNIKETDSDE